MVRALWGVNGGCAGEGGERSKEARGLDSRSAPIVLKKSIGGIAGEEGRTFDAR